MMRAEPRDNANVSLFINMNLKINVTLIRFIHSQSVSLTYLLL